MTVQEMRDAIERVSGADVAIATPAEGPGSFRRHEIEEFSGGMNPVSRPLIDAEMAS
jgi:hypothetical protein